MFGATAAEKISTPEPMAQHLCKTPKQENIYAKTYHSQAYLKDSSADLQKRYLTYTFFVVDTVIVSVSNIDTFRPSVRFFCEALQVYALLVYVATSQIN